MPTATGQLRYGPRGSTVPRVGWWMILECDLDWHALFAPHVHKHMPGRWVMAVDRDRVFDGRHVDHTPHLGLVKPLFQMPAWGPHVSVVRNEKPTKHLDVWQFHVRMGDVQQEILSMRESLRFYEDQSTAFSEAVAQAGEGRKGRREMEASLLEMRRKVVDRQTRLGRLNRELRDLKEQWRKWRKAEGFPEGLTSGLPVKFAFDVDLKEGRTHWWLDVQCKKVPFIREFYGLTPWPRVRLHLTVGVTVGGIPY